MFETKHKTIHLYATHCARNFISCHSLPLAERIALIYAASVPGSFVGPMLKGCYDGLVLKLDILPVTCGPKTGLSVSTGRIRQCYYYTRTLYIFLQQSALPTS